MEEQLKNKSLSTTVGKQTFIYLMSVFLPPLGLWPGIKYLKQKDDKSRMIGFIAITLTIISTAITVWFTLRFINVFNRELNNNLNLYR